MKKLVGGVLLTMLGVAGCSKESTPGGPGATGTQTGRSYQTPSEKPRTPETTDQERTFTLSVPSSELDLNRGEKKDVTIAIKRGSEFKESVKLQFNPPAGVTITPAEPVINSGEKDTKVTIESSPDAPVGKTNIEVTAIPDTGKTVSMPLAVEVHRKD